MLTNVGPFRVADFSEDSIVDILTRRSDSPRVACALHVGGLNERRNSDFVESMNAADFVYADGMSVVLIARVAGAKDIQRAPTTDIGIRVARGLTSALGRQARVALVGGPDGLAKGAAPALESITGCEVVYTTSGFHEDWAPVISAINDLDVDLIIAGLGMPKESLWAQAVKPQLDGAPLILTCGGWMGFLSGQEVRAPRWMHAVGLEWFFRVRQSPRRLMKRYTVGLVTTVSLILLGITRRAIGTLESNQRGQRTGS